MFRTRQLTEQQKIYKEFQDKRYKPDSVITELPGSFWFILVAGAFLIIFLVYSKKIMSVKDVMPYVIFLAIVLFAT